MSRQDREAARKRVHDDLAFSRAQACARVPDDVEQLHMEFEQLAPGADMLPEYQIAPMRDRHGREIDPGSLYYSSARES